jgi:protein-tyrosine phosphatase
MLVHPLFPINIVASNAQIILTPCPGTKGVDLTSSLEQIKQASVHAVLTFMTQGELDKNNLSDLGESVKNNGMLWFHLPIIDDHAPETAFFEAWKSAGPKVHDLLAQGKTIAVHCKGGSGRTGLISAQIMIERGEELHSVMARLKALRPNAFIHACHREYLTELAKSLNS